MAILTEEYIKDNTWKFLREDGTLITPVLRFSSNGVVGGYLNKLERCWRLTSDGGLALQDISGVTTTRLMPTEEDEHGVVELRGPSLIDGRIEHIIRRIKQPTLADFEEELPEEPIEFIKNSGNPNRRKNLLVLRANEKSLHYFWSRYITEEDRNWDLCISWYGRDIPENIGDCEYFIHQSKEYKFGAIYTLFDQKKLLWDYENFFFPDDDLEMSWRDINRLFNIFTRSRLDIAQPALAFNSSSFVNHGVTSQNKKYLLRYSNFIELMCPVFSREILKICLPAFRRTKIAFGLDHIWGGLEGRVPGRMAIIDDVAVSHSRPMGVNYNLDDVHRESGHLYSLYPIESSFDVIGGIRRDKTIL